MADPPQSPLNIDRNESDEVIDAPPLDLRVLQVVEEAGYKLRPAKLAGELGISVEDACAELCGLLAAVGGGQGGASFQFESLEGRPVMVFAFPPDTRRRALGQRRRQSLRDGLYQALLVGVKILKVVVAFGLILSLFIICVAAVLGLVGVLVALTRGGGDRHQSASVTRQIRTLLYTMRQLLWLFALTDSGEGGDPFLREIAYDLSLVFGVCCGNPLSIFFWMRAGHLHRRRHGVFRGWGDRTMARDVEGVTLIRRGSWNNDNDNDEPTGTAPTEYRGLLSVAVEFLFGPTPFTPGPTPAERWKLRAAKLLQWGGRQITLQQLSPWTDAPPMNLDDSSKVVSEGLLLVAHFNGVPSDHQPSKASLASFDFPELLAEGSFASEYEPNLEADDDQDWRTFFCRLETERRTPTADLPNYLKEDTYRLTKLPAKQFLHCAGLGLLNLIGVVWLKQSVSAGGVLQVPTSTALGVFLHRGLLPVLGFYAVLFFTLPLMRLVLLSTLNLAVRQRNQRREALATALELQAVH